MMARRSSIWSSPAGIVLGYLLALFAATAAVVSFPFSSISLGLLFVVVGAFFLVAVPVIVMAYLLMTIALARALMGLGRRLLFGAVQDCGTQRTIKPCPFQKDMEPPATAAGLWDQWIDGPRHRPEP
jgi:hypothetical protein